MSPVEKFKEAASPLISRSISTKFHKKIAIKVSNAIESAYSLKKNTQIAHFSVVTPEQSTFIKPLDTPFLNMTPDGDPDLKTYLTEKLRTNKPEPQYKIFWFPTHKTPGNTEDHSPILPKFLKKLHDLKEREKINPEDNVESPMKNLERFDWADTLLRKTGKQTVRDTLVEYQLHMFQT